MAPKTNGRGVQVEDTRICVVMVGLPARGKSYIAQKGKLSSFSLSLCLPPSLPFFLLPRFTLLSSLSAFTHVH